ncbi:MAG: glycoside hydrolase family 31 protein [Anaerolineaceae bacterium]|nr:glycoside hydrolase family 31 protein [Anaerolineaceae bacterium]
MQSTPNFQPTADPLAIVQSGKARFTVLTDRLIRLEYDPSEIFEDRASQVFWYRKQAVPPFKTWEENGWLHIETEFLYLSYKIGGDFFWRDLNILLKQSGTEWHFGDADYRNLKGTARTLDRADGPVPLEDGLVSFSGWSLVNDSTSLVFSETGWLEPRQANDFKKDFYFFGYGHEYLQAIQAYQSVSGKPELLPRWALGNWWSRYWPYSQEQLTQLMLEFKKRSFPLSVCIIDMDWHITKTGNKSSGWTGYTWNKELFPTPYDFVQFLHSLKLKTALNLHPAEGIHAHEESYAHIASSLGVDPQTKKPIEFDIASEIFTRAYFEILHHPMEAKGIDFWWMDWQQGTKTKTSGLDPLYWLNHLHYFNLGRTPQKRSFIFSRWPGLGGHRYPIGFSGDTIVSWASLAFQPAFTAAAANVAFGWWSHDIGGHCEGVENDELYLRWVQYGVFSPIMRLHSTNNRYCERLPWKHGLDVEEAARQAMQFRHRLIPLLYTAAWQNTLTGQPPILPLYYRWPEEPSAYAAKQSYLFCGQIISAPFTVPQDPSTGLTRQPLWLPKGDWYNLFTGEYTQGGSWTVLYGRPHEIPAFIPSGAIIPLNNDAISNGADIPSSLTLRIVPGKASTYTFYEDDGQSQAYREGQFATTQITQEISENTWQLQIAARQGNFRGAPASRQWNLEVFGISLPASLSCTLDGENHEINWNYQESSGILRVDLGTLPAEKSLNLQAQGVSQLREEIALINRVERVLEHAQLPSILKQRFFNDLPELMLNPKKFLGIASQFTDGQLLAIFEAAFNHQSLPISEDIQQAFSNMMNTFNAMIRS